MALSFQDYLRTEIYGGSEPSLPKKLFFRYYNPATNAVFLLRRLQHTRATVWGKLQRKHYAARLVHKYGIFVRPDNAIGIGLRLPHPKGIVIGHSVRIGDNCLIYQQVTIGSARSDDPRQPQIGDRCTLYAGAKVLGAIVVGDAAVIGANAVLLQDAPPNSVLVGIPAKALPPRHNR